MDQDIVSVSPEHDGEGKRFFKIHKQLLCDQTPLWREFFESQEETKVLILRAIGPEGFGWFARWLYRNELIVEEMEDESTAEDACDHIAISADDDPNDESDDDSQDSEDASNDEDNQTAQSHETSISVPTGAIGNAPMGEECSDDTVNNSINKDKPWYAGVDRKCRVFAQLLDLYIFAEVYETKSFKLAVMLRIQRLMRSTRILPGPHIIKYAFDALNFQSPLCNYLIDCYGHYITSETMNQDRFATLKPAFLTAVLFIAFRRIDNPKLQSPWDADWCDYHEHETDEEGASVGKRDQEMLTRREDVLKP